MIYAWSWLWLSLPFSPTASDRIVRWRSPLPPQISSFGLPSLMLLLLSSSRFSFCCPPSRFSMRCRINDLFVARPLRASLPLFSMLTPFPTYLTTPLRLSFGAMQPLHAVNPLCGFFITRSLTPTLVFAREGRITMVTAPSVASLRIPLIFSFIALVLPCSGMSWAFPLLILRGVSPSGAFLFLDLSALLGSSQRSSRGSCGIFGSAATPGCSLISLNPMNR